MSEEKKYTHDNTWFTELYSGDKDKIFDLHSQLDIPEPLAYSSATDFLLDVWANI